MIRNCAQCTKKNLIINFNLLLLQYFYDFFFFFHGGRRGKLSGNFLDSRCIVFSGIHVWFGTAGQGYQDIFLSAGDSDLNPEVRNLPPGSVPELPGPSSC